MYHSLIALSGVKELYTVQARKLLQRNLNKQRFLGGEGGGRLAAIKNLQIISRMLCFGYFAAG